MDRRIEGKVKPQCWSHDSLGGAPEVALELGWPLYTCIDQLLGMDWPGNRCDLGQGNSWELK